MSLSKWLWRTTRSCLNRQNIREEHLLQRATNLNGSLSKIIDDGLAISDLAKTTTLRERIRKMIEYHTIERVPVQGQITLLAYEMLEQPEKIKDHTLHQAVVLAWAVELIQSYFLIMDDLEDGAATRCGKPCWHLLPEVKTLVMNDASMFRSFIHEIIQQNFKEPLYTNLTTLFNEAYIQIAIGQHLDASMAGAKDLSLFTPENYANIVKYKCTYYTLMFPLKSALILCNKANKESYKHVNDLCKEIGALFQIRNSCVSGKSSWNSHHCCTKGQVRSGKNHDLKTGVKWMCYSSAFRMNDFMDCFDAESTTGKSGTDIQEGKCTWLAVNSLQRCSARQRKIFHECYGSWDPEHVARIKQIYEDMALTKLYKEDQRIRYENFMSQVRELPSNAVPSPALFLQLLNVIQSNQ